MGKKPAPMQIHTCIYSTLPHEQDATQGQFLSGLSGLNSEFSF